MAFLQHEWPVVLCFLEVLFFLVAAILVVCRFERFHREKHSQDDAHAFERCHLTDCVSEQLHPAWLCAMRAVAFVYMFPVQLYDLVLDGPKVYIFYTQWTFTLLIVYFAIATFASIRELLSSTARTADEESQTMTIDEDSPAIQPRRNKNDVGFLGYAMLLIFQVVAPSVLLTDAVYWFLLVPFYLPAKFHHSIVDISMHAVNAVFLFGEFFLNAMPFPWYRGSYLVFWTVTYLFLQWILHAAHVINWWPYAFLDLNTPWAPLWYFGLAVIHLLVFLLCLGLAKAKRPIRKLIGGE